MAPNYGISTRYGEKAQYETFLMSNIVPQKGPLNQVVWRLLEEKVATVYANKFEEIWVITGPIYDEQKELLPNGTEIPDAFFKIIVDVHKGGLRSLAFAMPEIASKQDFSQFFASIDQIEGLTGLDFFHELPDEAETKFEGLTAERMR